MVISTIIGQSASRMQRCKDDQYVKILYLRMEFHEPRSQDSSVLEADLAQRLASQVAARRCEASRYDLLSDCLARLMGRSIHVWAKA